MYIDQGEVVRVRVESDEFCDDEPGPPKVTEGVQMKRELKRPPYIVCVSGVYLSLLYDYLNLLYFLGRFYLVLDCRTRSGTRGVVEWCVAGCGGG
jgi:hypothetical protein